mmetsp:Transcript_16720/g.52079  ORF Transcript_16720/g.52079 Transcript_16720/m.52079 type:complete len:303 (+) Transcript_16720:1071-1979(+)
MRRPGLLRPAWFSVRVDLTSTLPPFFAPFRSSAAPGMSSHLLLLPIHGRSRMFLARSRGAGPSGGAAERLGRRAPARDRRAPTLASGARGPRAAPSVCRAALERRPSVRRGTARSGPESSGPRPSACCRVRDNQGRREPRPPRFDQYRSQNCLSARRTVGTANFAEHSLWRLWCSVPLLATMACCPMAACQYAAPLLLAAPTMYQKFRAASPSAKAAILAAVPVAAIACWVAVSGEAAAKFAEGVGRCKEAQITLGGCALLYAYLVHSVASAPPPEPAAPGKACPFSGKSDGVCPAARAVAK